MMVNVYCTHCGAGPQLVATTRRDAILVGSLTCRGCQVVTPVAIPTHLSQHKTPSDALEPATPGPAAQNPAQALKTPQNPSDADPTTTNRLDGS